MCAQKIMRWNQTVIANKLNGDFSTKVSRLFKQDSSDGDIAFVIKDI